MAVIRWIKGRVRALEAWAEAGGAWRTWLVTHPLVWVVVFEGGGALTGLLAAGVAALAGSSPSLGGFTLGGMAAGYMAGLAFYAHREFWPDSGHLWQAADGEAGRSEHGDSKMDFWLPWVVSTAALGAFAALLMPGV